MGLDSVELVMRLEDEFGISIPDEVASKIVTVGQTAEYIAETLAKQDWPTGVCSSAHTFRELRTQLINRFGVPCNSVRPDTPIGTLILPEHHRQWPAIADASGLAKDAKTLFRKRTPPPQTQIRELIETRCKTIWLRFDGSIDPKKVLQHVRWIVSDATAIPIEQIRPESHYIKDLHLD